MSALGQKQTSRSANVMSALPPKADIQPCDYDVSFGPIADIEGLSTCLRGLQTKAVVRDRMTLFR
jgi:hypothetical protein